MRSFLLAFGIFFLLNNFLSSAEAEKKAITLQVVERNLVVNGKTASVLGINFPTGNYGLFLEKGQPFNVILENNLNVPTSLHWHGLILPNGQDGVAFITQYPIYPKTELHYQFPLVQAGTYFMHSHYGLQEQRLLTAPLIITDDEDRKLADQEVVILLSDFSFKSPSEIYQELRCPKHQAMHMLSMPSYRSDIVEVEYDAYLANFKTLRNPEVFQVTPGKRVRLRLINASSATNFFVFMQDLEGEIIAVDGNRTQPLRGKRFELSTAQRMDLVVTIPEKGGFFPIFAQAEGTDKITGAVLMTPNATMQHLPHLASEMAEAVTNAQELQLRALNPLSEKPVDQKVVIELGGDMEDYVWTLNGQSWPEVTPVVVKNGERVEMIFKNGTTMSHPMHLHGHVFQVTEINGKKFPGALRDTILVPPNSTVAVQFDANNPGVWPLHCHILYHLEAGMLTVVRYDGYVQPLTK